MATGEQGLTHNEIWDDSALIDSWDQALEEYKHSQKRRQRERFAQAHGRRVRIDLMSPEFSDEDHSIFRGQITNKTITQSRTSDAKQNLLEIDESSDRGRLETTSEMKKENLNIRQETGNVATQHSQPRASGPPPAPAGLLGTIRDEGLKRLLMSWYYAGYYTGYYEGQRDSPHNQGPSE
ncbi:hypothetical protein FHL15_001789 [Xylaria flabelliformis]|uniref:Survival Motor Neuron Gemin2-binding domain-containing protein n=1 Tax=Xylaria flabelliformis TaxID=2512241 RepID=A0A553IBD8_9PEZI|nr:hypothetical protein FHL15_001789 [Xylaria flabelliformis]